MMEGTSLGRSGTGIPPEPFYSLIEMPWRVAPTSPEATAEPPERGFSAAARAGRVRARTAVGIDGPPALERQRPPGRRTPLRRAGAAVGIDGESALDRQGAAGSPVRG